MDNAKHQDWLVFDYMPEGWKICPTMGDELASPLVGHVFITDGGSLFNGRKRALLRVSLPAGQPIGQRVELRGVVLAEPYHPAEGIPKTWMYTPEQSKTVNDLARNKFKERLLADILMDLNICKIEGWDRKEYIKELLELIRGIEESGK